ncbi:MAG TPA: DUF3237 domain-containing protein [Polyangiaceae bacterium]|nr:DUF3237 domain-containing protein [Polyangiaceae bacterium]
MSSTNDPRYGAPIRSLGSVVGMMLALGGCGSTNGRSPAPADTSTAGGNASGGAGGVGGGLASATGGLGGGAPSSGGRSANGSGGSAGGAASGAAGSGNGAGRSGTGANGGRANQSGGAGSTAAAGATTGGNGGMSGSATTGAAGTSGGGASAQAGSGAGGASGSSTGTIVPDASWACGMAGGIPDPTLGTAVFSATLELGDTQDVGATQYGHRRILDVKGGSATGSRLQATFLTGGFDFELTRSNGVLELEQIDVLKASDGTLIYLRTCGVAPAGASDVRIVPDFEVATSNALAWLNTGTFVGTRTVDESAKTMRLDVYDVSSVTAGDPKTTITDPGDQPQQPWDCSTATGGKGATVFTENVTLGSSLSIGASKRGTRNIIPITGGTLSGQLTGSIVSGGGDYQLVGSTTKLDARYVLAPNDGEFVLVRNCGPLGSLVPLFEARADGPEAFLNANDFVSSDPGSGSGGVSITFYERK